MAELETLFEIVQSGNIAVDREAGLIRGVRILGPTSANGRKYSTSASPAAKPSTKAGPSTPTTRHVLPRIPSGRFKIVSDGSKKSKWPTAAFPAIFIC